MFADAIDFPLVFLFGLAVLLPLMLFQVGVEGWILGRLWGVPFRAMARFAFRANCLSLAAGFPTKILNSFLYGGLLPPDIPGFFVRYPFAVGLGTLIYFGVTVVVEFACAVRWRRREEVPLSRRSLGTGVLLANLATYAVLAPVHYYATRPLNDVREFTTDARWSSHPDTAVAFVDSNDGHLKLMRLGESKVETIVPASVKDYLIATNGAVCLFRDDGGNLVLYQRSGGRSNLVWQTDEQFSMNQVAFSPSAERVAFASEKASAIEVVEVATGKRARHWLPAQPRDLNVAWSSEEARFYIAHDGGNRFAVNIAPDFSTTLESLNGTPEPPLLACYGRVGSSRWWSGGDWGHAYSTDRCHQLRATAVPGLGSSLRIYQEGGEQRRIFLMTVNPGLLHLSAFQFGDVAFLEGCNECLFEASGGLYLIDLERKRLGSLAMGERFILFTPRYQKHL